MQRKVRLSAHIDRIQGTDVTNRPASQPSQFIACCGLAVGQPFSGSPCWMAAMARRVGTKLNRATVSSGYRCSRSFVDASARAESPAKANANAVPYCASLPREKLCAAAALLRAPAAFPNRASRSAAAAMCCAEPHGGSLPKGLAPPATTSLWAASDAPKCDAHSVHLRFVPLQKCD
jgi:hypothetical protein